MYMKNNLLFMHFCRFFPRITKPLNTEAKIASEAMFTTSFIRCPHSCLPVSKLLFFLLQ